MKYLSQVPLIGILRGIGTGSIEATVKAAMDGGFRTLEITLNRQEAFDQISKIKSRFGREIQLGAGTVLTVDAASKAIAAGAEFIVTPALVPEVIEFCKNQAIPVFPGAMTPTEILAAHQAGAEMVKVFPASCLGPAYIRSLKGPFPEIGLIPTGGVTLESVPQYFQAGASALGIGGELFKKEWVENKNWAEIGKTARNYVNAAKRNRD